VIEVRTTRGLRRLADPLNPPAVAETAALVIIGLPPGARLGAGPLTLGQADDAGKFAVALPSSPLAGHVGLLAVEVDGIAVGEVEIVAGKISRPAYEVLRAELRAVWAELLFDPTGITRVAAYRKQPDAVAVWARIAKTVEAIRHAPTTRLVPTTQRMYPAHLRTAARAAPRELVRAGLGLPAELPTVAGTTRTPENAELAGALLRLLRLAERQSGATRVATDVRRYLSAPPFDVARRAPSRQLPHGARADLRYRRVLTELRPITGPMTEPVEGPGVLRLGVRALPLLYEYWVFLQVLRQVAARFGPPISPGFAVLAVPQHGGGLRARLASGTTVRFPAHVVVAYEPLLRYDGTGDFGLELVRHPLDGVAALQAQRQATPDVLILRLGSEPAAVVVDAKYCIRPILDRALAEIHIKYGRVRYEGAGVVRHVVAASPHQATHLRWAGCSALQFFPGGPIETLPLDHLEP
jgi:hypothetical protein